MLYYIVKMCKTLIATYSVWQWISCGNCHERPDASLYCSLTVWIVHCLSDNVAVQRPTARVIWTENTQLNPCQASKTRGFSPTAPASKALPLIHADTSPAIKKKKKKKNPSSCQTLSFLLIISQAHERLKARRRRPAPNRVSG